MCAWLLLNKVLDAIDVFAGTARLSHCLRAKVLVQLHSDIKDWPSYVERNLVASIAKILLIYSLLRGSCPLLDYMHITFEGYPLLN